MSKRSRSRVGGGLGTRGGRRPATLQDLARASRAVVAAGDRLAAAQLERAQLVDELRAAGVSWRELAGVAGVSHVALIGASRVNRGSR